MSKLLLSSDLHLGHKNITKYRTQFPSADEHHNFVFENLASNIGKRDTLYLLGDVAFDKYWLEKVKSIKCQHKKLIIGNHDSEHHSIKELADAFDSIESLLSKRNIWFSHCPIHPQEMRGRLFNVHGHLHGKLVGSEQAIYHEHIFQEYMFVPDKQYVNVCLEHTNYKPISFSEIMERVND
jgi:calcineurin-like phosphoesterase family protein